MVSLPYRRRSATCEGPLRRLVVSVYDTPGPPGVALGILVFAVAGCPGVAGFMPPGAKNLGAGSRCGASRTRRPMASYAPSLGTIDPTVSAVPAAGNSRFEHDRGHDSGSRQVGTTRTTGRKIAVPRCVPRYLLM